jgi:hypothetical protein
MIKLKVWRVIIPIVLLFTACSTDSPEVVVKNGVGFTVPEGWRISNAADHPNHVAGITCEKAGVDESGIAVITIFDQSYDPSDVLINTREMMQQNKVYNAAGITYGDFKGEVFQQQQALSMPFYFTDQTSTHNGRVIAFTQCNKSITVLLQQAVADSARNAKGFAAMANAFSCAK